MVLPSSCSSPASGSRRITSGAEYGCCPACWANRRPIPIASVVTSAVSRRQASIRASSDPGQLPPDRLNYEGGEGGWEHCPLDGDCRANAPPDPAIIGAPGLLLA